jgi:hypothetical protein
MKSEDKKYLLHKCREMRITGRVLVSASRIEHAPTTRGTQTSDSIKKNTAANTLSKVASDTSPNKDAWISELATRKYVGAQRHCLPSVTALWTSE